MKTLCILQTIVGLFALSGVASAAPEVTNAVQLNRAYSAAISPDAKIIATGSYRKIELWDADSGKSLGQIEHKDGDARHLVFSPDGTLLIVANNYGKSVTVLEVNSRKVSTTINFTNALPLTLLGFTEDAKGIIIGKPKEIALLSLPDGAVTKSIPITGDNESFALLDGAKEVVTIGKFNGKLAAWDLQTGQASSRQFKQDKDSTPTMGARLSVASADKLAVASFIDHKVFVFDCGSGSLAHKVSDLSLQRAGFTKDGKTFAHGTWNTMGENFVNVVETATGKNLTKIGPFDKDTVFSSALLSSDGKLLVAVPNEAKSPVLVWHLK